MTAAAGPEPKDDGWMTSEVQRRYAAAAVVAEALVKERKSHNEDKTAKKRSEQWL